MFGFMYDDCMAIHPVSTDYILGNKREMEKRLLSLSASSKPSRKSGLLLSWKRGGEGEKKNERGGGDGKIK